MPKQIKLTDRVAEELARRAKEDNLSLAGEVAKLLSVDVGQPVEYRDNFVFGKLEYLESYIDKRLSHLESLIEDTTVDRLASGARSSHTNNPMGEPLDWDVFRYIVYDLCKDNNAPEWVSQSAHNAMDNLSDPITTIILDGYIWAVNDYGKSKLLKVSPRIEEAIKEGRHYE